MPGEEAGETGDVQGRGDPDHAHFPCNCRAVRFESASSRVREAEHYLS